MLVITKSEKNLFLPLINLLITELDITLSWIEKKKKDILGLRSSKIKFHVSEKVKRYLPLDQYVTPKLRVIGIVILCPIEPVEVITLNSMPLWRLCD